MTNVLLIDNKSAHFEKLQRLVTEKLGTVSFRVHDPRDMSDGDVEWADLVIFSGGTGRSIEKNPQTFERMVAAVVASGTPTVGICLGAEAMAVYYGSTLEDIGVRRVGNVRMHFGNELKNDHDLGESAMVYEFHRWKIGEVHAPLVELARSKDGVELFRHEHLPLWGLQFHPEVSRHDNPGHQIFEHALRSIGFK